KYNAAAANPWQPFPFTPATATSPASGAVIDQADNQVDLYLVDGGAGDSDGAANGVIVDPGALAVTPVTAAITGAPAAPPPLGTTVTLNSTVTDSAHPNGPFTYAWNVTLSQGGGTPLLYHSSSGSSDTFVAADAGTYVVTLTATDQDNVISNQDSV